MKKIFLLFMALMYLTNSLQASAENRNQISRTSTLLPDLEVPFEVELFLPEDFILIKHQSDVYYLGSKEISIPSFDQSGILDPRLLENPIIEVCFIKDPVVTSFQEYFESLSLGLKEHFSETSKVTHSNWGSYPILQIKLTIGLDDAYVAFVGLDEHEGCFLMLNLRYPIKKDFGTGNPLSEEDLQLWTDLLTKTKSY